MNLRWRLRHHHLYHSSIEWPTSNTSTTTATRISPIFVIFTRSRPRSSTIEVSKSLQKVIVLRSGRGRTDELKLIPANVLLISAFTASKGVSSLDNVRKRVRERWWTRSQIVNGALQYRHRGQGRIEACQRILEVRRKGNVLERIKTGNAKLGGLDVAERIYFVNPVDCGLNRGIGSCDIVLNRGAQRVERSCKKGVYLVKY